MTMMQRTVYVAVGVPGAGKTQWGKEKFGGLDPRPGLFHCVEMAQLRQFILGDINDHRFNRQISLLAYAMLRTLVDIGMPIIYWNNPSQTPRFRDFCIRYAKSCGYKAVAVYFPLTLEEAQVNNAEQKVPVPEHIIEKMWQSIDAMPPTEAEGFDQVITVKTN